MTKKDLDFLKKILGDAFQVRCLYTKPPYDNADSSDLGFRSLIWGDFRSPDDYKGKDFEFDHYKITLVKSALDFYNVYANLTLGSNAEILLVGPFSDHPYDPIPVQQRFAGNRFTQERLQVIDAFYEGLPVVDKGSLLALIGHLLEHLIPDYKNYTFETINYADNVHQIEESPESFFAFTYANSEEMVAIMQEFSDSLCRADPSSSISAFRKILDFLVPQSNNSISDLRHKLETTAVIISLVLLQTSVHPYYIFQHLSTFTHKLPQATSIENLVNMATNYVHKSCLLVRNYSYPDYSLLIKNTVNYIDQNLQENLSLSILANRVGKNASYLSALFNKEVGCTITEYVNTTRIQASLKYLTTTNMSIAEISDLVGISDFGYYSRLFKKKIGCTPTEYRKMLK